MEVLLVRMATEILSTDITSLLRAAADVNTPMVERFRKRNRAYRARGLPRLVPRILLAPPQDRAVRWTGPKSLW